MNIVLCDVGCVLVVVLCLFSFGFVMSCSLFLCAVLFACCCVLLFAVFFCLLL